MAVSRLAPPPRTERHKQIDWCGARGEEVICSWKKQLFGHFVFLCRFKQNEAFLLYLQRDVYNNRA